jgi:hypothetical protein
MWGFTNILRLLKYIFNGIKAFLRHLKKNEGFFQYCEAFLTILRLFQGIFRESVRLFEELLGLLKTFTENWRLEKEI